MPKFTLSLDSSQLSDYLTCPQYWNYRNRQNLRLTRASTLAMDRGTCMHSLLETFYKFQIRNPRNRDGNAIASSELVKASGIFEELKVSSDDRKLILLRFAEYVLYYQFRDFIPSCINGVDGVELGFSKILYEDEDVCFIFEGKIDLVVENEVGDIFWDHKCTSYTYYPHKLQLVGYAWATGFRYGGYNYVGLQKSVGKNTFRRNPAQFSESLIERWRKEIIKTFYRVKQDMLCDSFNENLKACSGPFDSNPCAYTSLCEAESGLSREAFKSFSYYKSKKWRPWEVVK